MESIRWSFQKFWILTHTKLVVWFTFFFCYYSFFFVPILFFSNIFLGRVLFGCWENWGRENFEVFVIGCVEQEMMTSCCVILDPNIDYLFFHTHKRKNKKGVWRWKKAKWKKKKKKFMQAPIDNNCSMPEQHIHLNQGSKNRSSPVRLGWVVSALKLAATSSILDTIYT